MNNLTKSNENNASVEAIQISVSQSDYELANKPENRRKEEDCIQKAIAMATMSEDSAKECMYCLPMRSGRNGEKNEISGKSIRFAELMVYCWTHIRIVTGSYKSPCGKKVVGWAYGIDVQNNNCAKTEISKAIYSERTKKHYSLDMQNMIENAVQSFAFRNITFRLIPHVFTDIVYKKVVECAVGTQKTLHSRRAAAISHFEKIGISKEKVLEGLNKKSVEDIDLEDLQKLIGITTSIKEGTLNIDNAFSAIDYVEERRSKLNDLNI
jgi:hypothetical protein